MRSVFGGVLGILGGVWWGRPSIFHHSLHEAPCSGPQLAFRIQEYRNRTKETTIRQTVTGRQTNKQTLRQRNKQEEMEEQVNKTRNSLQTPWGHDHIWFVDHYPETKAAKRTMQCRRSQVLLSSKKQWDFTVRRQQQWMSPGEFWLAWGNEGFRSVIWRKLPE